MITHQLQNRTEDFEDWFVFHGSSTCNKLNSTFFILTYITYLWGKETVQIVMLICLSLQIDTKNILFICGGAFVDLEKTISERL